MVSFYAGLRAKEIAALKLGDVFDETGAVRDQFILGVDQSKGRQRRTVYLNQRLRKALATYAKSKCLQELDRPCLKVKRRSLFGKHNVPAVLDIYKACGLKDASSHSGRRTYITRLANKGVGVRLLAELAGHSHISTTQRYIDVNSDQLSQAVELL
jgi:integrase/recombinase XerD